MKKIALLFGFIAVLLCTACQSDNDSYFTTAVITLEAGDNIVVEQVQATATFENLNSHEVVTSTDFNTNTLQASLLRGAYRVSVDGLIRYTDGANQSHVKPFRGQMDYVSLAEEGLSLATMKIILSN